MEISLSICEQCIVPVRASTGPLSAFAQVVVLLTQRKPLLLSEVDFGRLAKTSKELNQVLDNKAFWMGFLSLALARVPPGFSVLRLFRLLRAQRKNAEWKRDLLTTAVSDDLSSNKVLRVHVSTSGLDSVEFWKAEFNGLMCLATHPTAPQAQQLVAILDVLVKRGVSGPTLYSWVAALDGKKRNKVLVPFFIQHTVTHAELSKGVTAEMIAALLNTMRAVFDLVGLLYHVSLDDLRKSKWTLSDKPSKKDIAKEPFVKKKKKGKAKRAPPASAVPVGRPKKPLKDRTIKAIALAMSAMTWLQLSDMYGPNKGLAKTVFAVTHINAVFLKRQAALSKAPASKETEEALRGVKQAQLAVLCLRGCRYPATAEGWPKYVEQVQRPLAELDASNPLVKVDQRFLQPAYDPALANLKLKVPHSRTVDAVLSQDGNSVSTWDHLLNTRGTTAANVFQHWRSLVLLAYDPEKLFAFLEKRLAGLDLFKLMAIRTMLLSSFEPALFATVRGALEATPVDTTHPRSEGGKVARLVLGERTFQDKQGTSSKQVITRSVATSFGPATFEGHLRVCNRLCAIKLQPAKPPSGTAVLFVTNELLNSLRKGTPPAIPAYSQASLWRNEAVCLSELAPFGEPPIGMLRAGITWCQKPGQGNVDLDLSVTLFDKEWTQLGTCSYSQTQLGSCIKHSGDIRSAPWPDGAREAIEIDLVKLRTEFPAAAFIALQVYSYSGTPYEDLADGSVFLADPSRTGTGPGGQAILSAARLTGAGTTNISGFVHFDAQGRTHFFCLDHTLNTESRSASTGVGLVGEVCRTVYSDRIASTPKTLRGVDVGSLLASMQCKRTLVVHADPKDVNRMAVTEVEPRENAFESFLATNQAAVACAATHSHRLPTELLEPLLAGESEVVLVHGALPDYERLVQSLPMALLNAPQRKLTTVNVGVDITKRGDREVPAVPGVVDAVQGPGALELLAGFADTAEAAPKKSAPKKAKK